jgi:tetraacyldisaccharide 4'-kinase
MGAILKIILLPFSFLYWLITATRNKLFDFGVLPSKEFDFPVICIGNLSVGGTGKTPHTEYIISLLANKYKIAVLSRGYKRKTKGFKIVDINDTAETVGDEPLQIFLKNENIIVAVDEKRHRGISNLRSLESKPDIILLDDAFQHRKVKAGLNILLTDYSKPYTEDFILPSGRLRESKNGSKRADLIVVTKSPSVLSPLEIRRITSIINPEAYQKVFFSYIDYLGLNPLNTKAESLLKLKENLKNSSVLLVSAIANPKPLKLYLKRHSKEVKSVDFSDHHQFEINDYERIKKIFDEIFSQNKSIVITEKDAVKFDLSQFNNIPVFCIPISISFHTKEEESFNKEIETYVRSYRTK